MKLSQFGYYNLVKNLFKVDPLPDGATSVYYMPDDNFYYIYY